MSRPLVLIIGERRCGTTSLYRMLAAHPEIAMLAQPDFNYFLDERIVASRSWQPGHADPADWERTHSPEDYWSRLPEAGGGLVGHKGADLFYLQEAHARIERFAPEARLIVLVRNPVRRAWSQYWNEYGKGRETRSFEQALAEEGEQIAAHDYARDHLSYGDRGHYARSYQRLVETIDPQRVLVVVMEDLYKNTAAEMQRVFAFLGVDPHGDATLPPKQKNQNWTLVDKPAFRGGVRGWGYRQWQRICEKIICMSTKDTERRRSLRKRLYAPFTVSADTIQMSAETHADLAARYVEDARRLGAILDKDLVSQWRLG